MICSIIRIAIKILSEFMLRFENTPLNDHVKFDRMSNLLENRLYTTHTQQQWHQHTVPTFTYIYIIIRIYHIETYTIIPYHASIAMSILYRFSNTRRFFGMKCEYDVITDFIPFSTRIRKRFFSLCALALVCIFFSFFFFVWKVQHFIFFEMFQSIFSLYVSMIIQ